MKVINGLIEGAEQVLTKNNSGPYARPPTLLVMHFTASGVGIKNDAAFFADQSKTSASAHLLVGKGGELIQCVSFDKIAHHAGTSSWRGQSGCNNFSIGIEVDNWGVLTKREDGSLRSWTGAEIGQGIAVRAKHKNRATEDYWETYPEAQLRKLEEVTLAILAAYPSIKEIVGHDDVAPGRKTDPGPAFPMRRFQCMAEDRSRSEGFDAVVLASKLNVRTAPGTQSPTQDWGPLLKGTHVKVIDDGADWDLIEADGLTVDGVVTNNLRGWVASQYLVRA